MNRGDVMALLTGCGMRGSKAGYDDLAADARRGARGIELFLGRLP